MCDLRLELKPGEDKPGFIGIQHHKLRIIMFQLQAGANYNHESNAQ